MATKLRLKNRNVGGTVTIDVARVRSIMERPEDEAKDLLYRMFENLKDVEGSVHDKKWLEEIVNYIPTDDQGRPQKVTLVEQAKWLRLAERVAKLDGEREGDFTLSDYQETIIWERLNSPDFKISGMPQAFVLFVLDFLEATGRRFADMEPEKEEENGQ